MSREERSNNAWGDSAALPLQLGFMGESEKQQPMETEGGGLTTAPVPDRGKKRPPPSPPPDAPADNEDSSRSATDDDNGDWLVSGSEDDEDHDNTGSYPPFNVDDIPRVSCDHEEQSDILHANPHVKLRGPSPIRLLPAFKCGKHVFGSDYNLADTSELSVINVGDCSNECHCWPMDLLQFIDINIAGYRHTRPGLAKIFGFIAARETAKPLRNYIYRRGIENCEAVSVKRKTGVARLSLSSPARVISMPSRALIEFELHAQNEDEINGDDDLIIEGCTEIENIFRTKSFIEHQRLYGERCALDIKYAVLITAIENQVSIEVLRIPTHGVNLKVYAKTSGFSDVIRLFRGAALDVGFVMNFVVAVEMHNLLDLYIEGFPVEDPVLGQKPLTTYWWQCSFLSRYHETTELVAELGDFATFSVKVTCKTYLKSSLRR